MELINEPVAVYTQSDGSWNWSRFSAYLPFSIITCIAAVLPPSPFQGPDFVVWRFSSSGLFSLKTGYEWLEGLHDEHPGGVWNSVGIGRVLKRSESHLHVLHDCSFTQQVWFDLRPPGAWDNFVATNPVDLWIGYNISSQQLHHSGYSWALIFGVTCWMLWMHQNRVIFAQEHSSISKIVQ
ncbi:hypothetical protein GH714_003123 [Hevea brasiliensis]|uniref:Uncharacterized protein n=1 Tax=Hevea brasiliensis TaxID=3981 RepID=A0A6A6MB87_HEVBR|nr:hypothetical protein GH714_003123 [Hevea brasiliensis]